MVAKMIATLLVTLAVAADPGNAQDGPLPSVKTAKDAREKAEKALGDVSLLRGRINALKEELAQAEKLLEDADAAAETAEAVARKEIEALRRIVTASEESLPLQKKTKPKIEKADNKTDKIDKGGKSDAESLPIPKSGKPSARIKPFTPTVKVNAVALDRARLLVKTIPEAKLYFDGRLTKATDQPQRSFVVTGLTPGQVNGYALKIEWGNGFAYTRDIEVVGGNEIYLELLPE